MNTFGLFSSSKARTTRRQPARARLHLEELESRTLLSASTLDNSTAVASAATLAAPQSTLVAAPRRT
jgi:hypothetical protein